MQAGGFSSLIGHIIIGLFMLILGLLPIPLVIIPVLIVGSFFPSIMYAFELIVSIFIIIFLIIIGRRFEKWMEHHLKDSHPILTITAKFLKYSSVKGSRARATFLLSSKKKFQIGYDDYKTVDHLKRGDIVKVTYQGVKGISAEMIPPSPPPPKPQFSKPQTLQGIQRKPLPPARKTTTPQSRYNNPTRK